MNADELFFCSAEDLLPVLPDLLAFPFHPLTTINANEQVFTSNFV